MAAILWEFPVLNNQQSALATSNKPNQSHGEWGLKALPAL